MTSHLEVAACSHDPSSETVKLFVSWTNVFSDGEYQRTKSGVADSDLSQIHSRIALLDQHVDVRVPSPREDEDEDICSSSRKHSDTRQHDRRRP